MLNDPKYQFYLSSVVMRIPGYNGDMEEPWYWEKYGRDIYEFSYYTDKAGAQQIRAFRSEIFDIVEIFGGINRKLIHFENFVDISISSISWGIKTIKQKQKCTKNLFLRMH